MASDTIDLLRSIEKHLAKIAVALSTLPPPAINPNQAYRRDVAARLLGVGVYTIDRARKAGLLREAQRLSSRDIRITGESMVRFQNEQETSGMRVLRL